MTNDISDTDFSEFNEQPAEPSAAAETSAQTLISHAQDSIMHPPQSEETSQMEILSTWAHENTEEPSNDLHTVRNFIYTIITLSQEFLTSLDEKGDTDKTLRITKQKINRRSKHSNSKETSYHYLPRELHKATKTLEQKQQSQLQDQQSQTSKTKKPENRECYRCGKFGHIARNCRSRPLPKNYFNQINQNIFSDNKVLFDNRTINSY